MSSNCKNAATESEIITEHKAIGEWKCAFDRYRRGQRLTQLIRPRIIRQTTGNHVIFRGQTQSSSRPTESSGA